MTPKEKYLVIPAVFVALVFASVSILGTAQQVYAQSGISEIWEGFWPDADSEREPQASRTENSNEDDGKISEAEAQETANQKPRSVWEWVVQFWHFPVIRSGDAWIRLNQLILSLVGLIAGGGLVSLLSRLLGRTLKRQKRIDQNTATAIEKTFFYFCILLTIVLVVQIADLPLAFLNLLGVIFAIGAALGAKNTIHDYMSGMILALEKPLRVGDCIEVEHQLGFVSEVSGRYTVLRRFDGINALVPNSTLLEKCVVNWTLQDSKIRGDVRIGITYDSPVGKAAEIIRQAIDENEKILAKPFPGVIFEEFGESAFVLWGWFWADVNNPLEIWSIQSDIRFRIVELLRENRITIAYPHRDVHLVKRAPLSVGTDASNDGRAEALGNTAESASSGQGSEEEVAEMAEELKPHDENTGADKP